MIEKQAGFLLKKEHIQTTFCYFTAIKCEVFDRYEVSHVLLLCSSTETAHQNFGQPKSLYSVDIWLNIPTCVGMWLNVLEVTRAAWPHLWDLFHPWMRLSNSNKNEIAPWNSLNTCKFQPAAFAAFTVQTEGDNYKVQHPPFISAPSAQWALPFISLKPGTLQAFSILNNSLPSPFPTGKKAPGERPTGAVLCTKGRSCFAQSIPRSKGMHSKRIHLWSHCRTSVILPILQ